MQQEAHLGEKQNFNEFHTAFAEVDTVFMQSKKTGRWWMQLPDKKIIAAAIMIIYLPVIMRFRKDG